MSKSSSESSNMIYEPITTELVPERIIPGSIKDQKKYIIEFIKYANYLRETNLKAFLELINDYESLTIIWEEELSEQKMYGQSKNTHNLRKKLCLFHFNWGS